MSQIDTFIINVESLKRNKTIRVYLPPNYHKENVHYDVLYMHDGHNLFDKATSGFGDIWDAHHALDIFYDKYQVGIILVGIDCDKEHRFDEYSPWKSDKLDTYIPYLKLGVSGGEGSLYIDWLVHELIPLIKRKYRTTNINYLAGSSMGGLITLYAGYKYPHIFYKIGALSTAIWFAKEELIKYIKENFTPSLSVYLDVGTKEGIENQFISDTYLQDTLDVANILKKLGCLNLKLFIDENAIHSETAWKNRFPIFIEWLLFNK